MKKRKHTKLVLEENYVAERSGTLKE